MLRNGFLVDAYSLRIAINETRAAGGIVQTFSPARLSSLPAIFLSFSFIAHAAPAGVEPAAELEHTYDQLTEAKALVLDRKPQVSTSLLLDSQCAESSTNPSTHVDALVGLLNTCTRSLSGVSVSPDASAKAEIAQLVADILVSISRSYDQISFKVGSAAYLALWAKLDLALQLLLLNLHFCLGGMLKLVADLLASATVGIFAKLKLSLCLNILGLGAGFGLNLGFGI
ncbi:hypothetical protein BDV93DRAFT_561074 [Ceratobasidium sp. AG-I]|nr:hypothetical protein BDV93DRAFT_561074 [Ceratobasidium sp. AG-I]